jgi:short-subunit dehydrogenase involved in D-alanine esterification of teichoic acids
MDATTTNWILIAIGMVGLILTMALPLVAYLNSVASKARHEISAHKTHVAENYATKDDVKDLGDRMERQMIQGFDNLEKLLSNRKTNN